ncbi:SDR family NAD(P)-dependent oxidoreductase [Reinekea sp. G2M2-21]|uniref:SDR family NAD(P)-dependent oxidoreductase n=1 Tax=Reinekea sp. G2M2-21 TaxID=2788942 RepID=UPI001E3F4418|nr:SDR family oxidoreductase [Reinekea sp. G2M2-21]
MKTILITGGTSGIGAACASYFVQQGYRVYITGRDLQRLNAVAADVGAQPMLCDAADGNQITDMARQLKQDNIRLDALVLNAGVFYPAPAISDSADNIDLTLKTNFVGPLQTIQALMPLMKNPSSIVYVSSIAVVKAAASCAVYSASKAAFEAAARVMNLELSDAGVRINSVRPGITRTEIQRKAGMTDAAIAQLNESLAGIPLGRMLTPEEIVPSIALLVNDSSLGMRSAAIEIDGGFAL